MGHRNERAPPLKVPAELLVVHVVEQVGNTQPQCSVRSAVTTNPKPRVDSKSNEVEVRAKSHYNDSKRVIGESGESKWNN